MPWYAAHIIIRLDSGNAREIRAWESVLLIEANDPKDADNKAKSYGRLEETIEDGLEKDGTPVKRVFAGVRKIVSISNELPPQSEDPPADGSEITYNEYEFIKLDDLADFVDGKEVQIRCID